jgi:retron-type reverse transcriptase
MKRYSNLWEKIITPENISLAFDKAKKGKSKYYEVRKIEQNKDFYLEEIKMMLENQTFKTSPYKIKKIYEPKERDIYVLPFYPDRIVQHCLMNIIEPIWDNLFIHDSYACRKGKGQHKASQRLMHFIRKSRYKFYLQGDIKKFYPSINHDLMKNIIRKK